MSLAYGRRGERASPGEARESSNDALPRNGARSRQEPGNPRREVTAPASAEHDELLESFRSWMIGGRWLLVAAETVETLLLCTAPISRLTLGMLGLLFGYNLLSLALLHRVPIRRVPLGALLTLDLCFVGVISHFTGGSSSPFLGQMYLIIFAAAVAYGRNGGLLVGVVAAGFTTLLALFSPGGLWTDMRDLIPYFLVAGGFSGSLMERMRHWFGAYQSTQAENRLRELESAGAKREGALARAMQLAALPSQTPSVPGVDLAAGIEFAQDVGGDLYLFLHEPDRLGLVVGDVCGKGVPAALAATSISHLLPWLHPLRSPETALANLNDDLAQRLPGNSFASLCLLSLEPATGRMQIWNGGHPPPLHWRQKEGRISEAQVFNPLLGILPVWEGESETWQLAAGDVVLLYSDGLTETRNVRGELYGEARAAAVLAAQAHRPAAEILEAVRSAVYAWGTPADDVTLLVCKYLGAGEVAAE
jgi:hypothetical protein